MSISPIKFLRLSQCPIASEAASLQSLPPFQGHSFRQTNSPSLGDLLKRAGLTTGTVATKKDQDALTFTKAAIVDRNADAQFKLGQCCERGDGIRKNPEHAFYWYEKAAHQGHRQAQFRVGECYTYCLPLFGVEQDYRMAVRWYERAAKQGHKMAQTRLAESYRFGQGVSQNKERAEYWSNQVGKSPTLLTSFYLSPNIQKTFRFPFGREPLRSI